LGVASPLGASPDGCISDTPEGGGSRLRRGGQTLINDTTSKQLTNLSVALGNETSEVRTGRKSRNLLIDIGKQLLDGTGLSHGELLNGNPTRMAPERNNGKHELKTESRNAGMHPRILYGSLGGSLLPPHVRRE
jgi:hypothetical protein